RRGALPRRGASRAEPRQLPCLARPFAARRRPRARSRRRIPRGASDRAHQRPRQAGSRRRSEALAVFFLAAIVVPLAANLVLVIIAAAENGRLRAEAPMRHVQGDAIGTVRGAQANPPASHSHSAIAADHVGVRTSLLAANRITIRCTRWLVHFSTVNPL